MTTNKNYCGWCQQEGGSSSYVRKLKVGGVNGSLVRMEYSRIKARALMITRTLVNGHRLAPQDGP